MSGFAGLLPAGLKGLFTAADTKQPLSGVLIQAIETGYATSSDKAGRYDLTMASGVYDIEVSALGYQTVVIVQRKIEVGTQHRFNLALEAAVVANQLPMANALSEILKDMPVTNGAVV